MGQSPSGPDLRLLPTPPRSELVKGFLFVVFRLHLIP
jgi:hypothetical protein